MRRIAFLLVAVATLASVIAYMVPASGQATQNSAPVYVTKIPSGYRDWSWISSAHEAGNLNSLGAVLGNDVAINAYREGKLPFPMALSLLRCITVTSHPTKTTKSLAKPNLSFPALPQTFSFGQGLNKVRRNRRLGVRSLPRRQTCRRGFHETLLPLP